MIRQLHKLQKYFINVFAITHSPRMLLSFTFLKNAVLKSLLRYSLYRVYNPEIRSSKGVLLVTICGAGG